jgi:hypothetical protein
LAAPNGIGRFASRRLNPAALAAALKLIVGDFDIAVRIYLLKIDKAP